MGTDKDSLKEVYDGYYVDCFGNVYSNRKTTKLTKLKLYDKDGYKKVWMYINKKRRMMYVHRLVCMSFIPNPDNLPMINHKDRNRGNNNVENLEWCDAKYNVIHSYKNGREGYKGIRDKGWNKYYKEWSKLFKEGLSYRGIAKIYNTTHHTIKRTIEKMEVNNG